jgi:DNA recombination protein RmuC
MDITITLLIGLAAGALLVYFLTKRTTSADVSAETMKPVIDQLISLANQKLGEENSKTKLDLENKRGEIERLIKMIREDLKENRSKLEMTEKEREGMFKSVTTSLDEYKKITEQLKVSTEGLKSVLSNNQLRGKFGEEVAEELLKMAGFVIGTDYEFNKEQEGSDTRPDFAIFLPDKTRINVDAKFPYANLQKSAEAEDDVEKKKYLKDFEQDVKQKIKQVTTRDYINPEDKTVDFVLLFIPNEMIFSYIYDRLNEVWRDAMEKKVILVGPFSFTALLRMIKQSYDNFRVQGNIQKIVGHVRGLEKEFVKFSEEFDKLGERILSLSRQYDQVGRTRVNQMNRIMDKVKLEDGSDSDQPKLID